MSINYNLFGDLKNIGADIGATRVELPEQKPRGRPRKSADETVVETQNAIAEVKPASQAKPKVSRTRTRMGVVKAGMLAESAQIAEEGSMEDITNRLKAADLEPIKLTGLSASVDVKCKLGHKSSQYLSEIMRGAAYCVTCGCPKTVGAIREKAEKLLGPLSLMVGPAKQFTFASDCGGFKIKIGKEVEHGTVSADDAGAITIQLRPGRGYIANIITKAAKDHGRELPITIYQHRPGRLPVSADMAELASSTAPNPFKSRLDMNVVFDESICFENATGGKKQ